MDETMDEKEPVTPSKDDSSGVETHEFFAVERIIAVKAGAVFLTAAGAVFLVLFMGFAPRVFSLAAMAAASAGAGGYVLARLHRPAEDFFYKHLLLVVFLVDIAAAALLSGGLDSPVLVWLVLLPVAAGFMINFSAVFWYGGLGAGGLGGVAALQAGYGAASAPVSGQWGIWFSLFNIVAVLLAVSGFLWFFLGRLFKITAAQGQMEEKYRKMSTQAEDASRAKGEFLANMSHEIRTPMNGIIGILHVLMETEMTAEQEKYLTIVSSSANALLSIINDILDFSKIEAGKLDLDIMPFDLEMALDEITAMPATQARQKGIDFEYAMEPDVPRRLMGDPGRIRQIMNNLIGNAVKFTDEGEVTLQVDLVSETEHTAVVRFTVNDTGIGIAPENMEKLFRDFSQADASTTRNYGGTGLGLAICKLLAEKMNGTIGVESMEMIGSTFWFTAELEKDLECPVKSAKTPCRLEALNVLVTSDAVSGCARLEGLIEKLGITVTMAGTARQVPELLKTACLEREKIDIVMVDVQETDHFAEGLAETIQKEELICDVQLVILTPIGKKGDARRFEAAGFDAFLSKPVDEALLEACFKTLVEKRDGEGPRGRVITRHSIAENRKYATRILVAEDKETNIVVARHLLNNLGFEPDFARNGQEAVEKVQDYTYDIVFMDTQMPVMDGIEATEQIRAMEKREEKTPARIIAMTANVLPRDRENCFKAGMDDFIAKPVDPGELFRVLHTSTVVEDEDPHTPSETDMGMEPVTGLPGDKEALPAPSPGANNVPVYDREGLLDRFGHNEELIETVVQAFVQEGPDLVESLKNALDKQDFPAARNVSHALKGCAANAGAPGLSAAALEMEKSTESRDGKEVGALMEIIEARLDAFIEETAG
ncbi:MAG: response regulator [Desulfobacteraceae bacterium]